MRGKGATQSASNELLLLMVQFVPVEIVFALDFLFQILLNFERLQVDTCFFHLLSSKERERGEVTSEEEEEEDLLVLNLSIGEKFLEISQLLFRCFQFDFQLLLFVFGLMRFSFPESNLFVLNISNRR